MCIKTRITRNISYHKARNWYANLVKPKQLDPPYKHVIQIGDPRLRAVAEPIPTENINTDEIRTIIKKVYEVFVKYDCIGLAAPQVGIPLQLFIIRIDASQLKKYKKEELENKIIVPQPLTVAINPKVTVTDFNKVVFAESCESVKGFWADVPRFQAVDLEYFDQDGEPKKLSSKGWLARVIQHEMDHLNGKLYTDAMDRKTLTCGCWEVVNERNGKVTLPYGPV